MKTDFFLLSDALEGTERERKWTSKKEEFQDQVEPLQKMDFNFINLINNWTK